MVTESHEVVPASAQKEGSLSSPVAAAQAIRFRIFLICMCVCMYRELVSNSSENMSPARENAFAHFQFVAQLEMNWGHMQKEVIKMSKEAYDWAIRNGIAKEQARVVLPEGLTKTKLYMNGTLRSWVHYIELRGANGTQKEHMEIAHECAKVIAKIFPLMKELDV